MHFYDSTTNIFAKWPVLELTDRDMGLFWPGISKPPDGSASVPHPTQFKSHAQCCVQIGDLTVGYWKIDTIDQSQSYYRFHMKCWTRQRASWTQVQAPMCPYVNTLISNLYLWPATDSGPDLKKLSYGKLTTKLWRITIIKYANFRKILWRFYDHK